MDMQAVENYISENKRIEMPDIQEQFALTYSNTVKVLSELEKKGKIKYCDGLIYEWKTQEGEAQTISEIYIPKNEQEAKFIKALLECIKSGCANTSIIQRKCSVGYATAVRAIDWMEENGFISSMNGSNPRSVLISQDDFIKRFGNSDDEESAEEEDMDSFMERRRRELMERLSHMDDDEEEDDDDDDDGDEEDDNDDIDKAAQERREYLEKRRQELIERMQREMAEDEGDDKEDHAKCAEALKSEIRQMPNYNSDDDTFSIAMNVSYPNGVPFRIKVLEHDGYWYLSDLGDALKYLSLFNDRDMLAEYFRDALKTENMCFIEDAVCTTIDDIHDLSGEASFLFKVVNGLITQKYFDVYYLGDKFLMLAKSILKENDAEMLVNALSVLNEKPVRVSALQKKLHIGHARATRLINTLTKLNILSSDGVKTDKISNGFIAYVRRMLDKRSGE